MKLILRGHHLLCLQGFQGYGYDENFVKNMAEINQSRKLDDTTISITNEADDICKACPNLKNNLCENNAQNERIISMSFFNNSCFSHKNHYVLPTTSMTVL